MSLVEHQLKQRIVVDLSTIKGEDFHEKLGEWFAQSLSSMHEDCMNQGLIPHVKVETLTLPRVEYFAILTEAFLDELGIVYS